MHKTAKEVVSKDDVEMNIKLSKSEEKSRVWREINKQWRRCWENKSKGRHLHKVQSEVGEVRWRNGGNREEEVIMSRLSNLNSTLLAHVTR